MERNVRRAPDAQQRAPERFPFTKFVPPVLDARVAATHLVARLNALIGSRPLTVVVAPAGSAKTTALAAWASVTPDDVVRVRLDAQDDEPSALAASNGWAAAVRLATARVGVDAASAVATRLGLGEMLTDLRPFLADEVFAPLPERLRTFLIEESILDELDPAICDLVTGRDDSDRLLEELDRRNLFVTRHPSPVTVPGRRRPGAPTSCSPRSYGSSWLRPGTRQRSWNSTAGPAAVCRPCGHSRICWQRTSMPRRRS